MARQVSIGAGSPDSRQGAAAGAASRRAGAARGEQQHAQHIRRLEAREATDEVRLELDRFAAREVLLGERQAEDEAAEDEEQQHAR